MSLVNLGKVHPEVYRQVSSLGVAADAAAEKSGVSPRLVELIKVRVSQINGCAYCLRLHTRNALQLGISPDQIAVLTAWRESQYFSKGEQEALALAEEATQLTVCERAISEQVLSDEQISAITWVVLVTNTWNRVAIRSGYLVRP